MTTTNSLTASHNLVFSGQAAGEEVEDDRQSSSSSEVAQFEDVNSDEGTFDVLLVTQPSYENLDIFFKYKHHFYNHKICRETWLNFDPFKSESSIFIPWAY